MDGFRPVDPTSREAQEAIANLLGTTLAQLKEIDKTVVGSSKNISGVKTDLKNVFANIPVNQPPPVQQPPVISYQPSPVATVVNAGINTNQSPVIIQEDPNQLVFDFSKKITPDTINDKLDRILSKLDTVISKLDKVAIT